MSTTSVKNRFDSLLFVHPGEFSVEYRINTYMRPGVDAAAARSQWEAAVERVREYAEVTVTDYASRSVPGVRPVDGLPDTVFCANHGVPIPGEGAFVRSRMAHEERADEVAHFEAWAAANDYRTVGLSDDIAFEGAGDAKWQPDAEVLWVGYGPRTDRAAVGELDDLLDARVVGLELVSEDFYHLDVCFTPLDDETAIIVEEAFTPSGVAQLEAAFETVLRVPAADIPTMGGNCSRIAPGVVAVDTANTGTRTLLDEHGYTVVPVETSEFRKSGGSIDCLFLRLP